MRGRVIGEYLDALSNGDPIAVGMTLVFVALGGGFAVFAWVIKRRTDAEDRKIAEKRKKRGY